MERVEMGSNTVGGLYEAIGVRCQPVQLPLDGWYLILHYLFDGIYSQPASYFLDFFNFAPHRLYGSLDQFLLVHDALAVSHLAKNY